MNRFLLLILSFCTVFYSTAQDLSTFMEPAKFRNIGPFRGGRSTGSSGVVGDPLTYYMGTTGGGLWKTTDAGQHWHNISDGYFKTGSVGVVSVSESHPNTVYVGMGEHAPRGVTTSYGDGVYKSTDAGKTWRHMGLENTRHISRIVIHPDNPDIIWVAAQGALHGPTQERGIYKSTDGGNTWKNVLFVNDLTGCSDLSIDMHNPMVLYAAMWEHIRKPWKVISGGPGSGMYKSTDGGETWFQIHKGLPEEKGKMAVAVSRANPDRVYALVESDTHKEKGGLFVSSNAGDNWSRVSGDHRLIQRAWYYIEIAPDPNNEHTIYVMSASTYRSIDGGKSWEEIPTHHGDYHDLWINPDDSDNMVISDDGGAEITFDKGKSWSRVDNMPTAQFYRVAVDNQFPYNLYGGQQDNTSVKISSIGMGTSGIGREHWEPSAGGESAFLAFDPDNPEKVMGGSYLGTVNLLNVKAKTGTKVMIEPNLYLGLPAREMKYLFNWNAPIIKSVHEPNTYYHAAQKVLRTRDEGNSWEEMSPDLTRDQDDKQGNGGGPYTNEAVGAENYGTLSYIIESPHEAGVFYTGSDDGLLHITRDNGANWENVTPKGLPESLINAIEVSPHDPGTVYIATTRYKFNDFAPSLYKSTNYGSSWQKISEGIPYGAFTRVVREDPKRKDLLVCGTETGLYISFNGGKRWESLKSNLPVVPITDLKLAHDDIIIATQGRSFWIFDDLPLLRQYDGNPGETKIYKPEDVIYPNWYSSMNSSVPKGTNSFEGVNPASGMVVYYALPELADSLEVRLEIRDADGALVRSFTTVPGSKYRSYEGAPSKAPLLPRKEGLNRFVWDLRHSGLPGIPEAYIEGSFRGRRAMPGTYTLTLKHGDFQTETKASILPNPHIPTTQETWTDYEVTMKQAEARYREMTEMTNTMFALQGRMNQMISHMETTPYTEVTEEAKRTLVKVKAWDAKMVQRLSKAYDDVENYVNGFTAEYLTALNHGDSGIPRINTGTKATLDRLDKEWVGLKREAELLMSEDIEGLNREFYELGIGPLYLDK
ncbi:WD40/YVTN/BNR-like repeat-containing protein [Robiginitalea aurantiaca]|uniref:Glycosyl hydrolase n=1 Tax=Robiginitalea aurantiaca TaxID=3056915 RepID=A0ABT7WB66_9FLAO|nr:glycosyl hydrolase [Robiginitalea aurantiaca]MDM9630143.1 glycosyl hydrolase [Robiginitalea aurantiaca]